VGVAVGVDICVLVDVAVGGCVLVAVGVKVNLGVLVGFGVFVGLGVLVGRGVFVGLGVLVGLAAACTKVGAPPRKDTRIRKMIVNRLDLNKNVFMTDSSLYNRSI
jgi:carbonic anhydrase/acetyltransferase-like protein (isoleucine patch superfamily)